MGRGTGRHPVLSLVVVTAAERGAEAPEVLQSASVQVWNIADIVYWTMDA